MYLTIDHNFTIKQFWKFFYTILLKSLSKLFVISSWRMRKFSGKKNLTFQTISKQEPRTFPTYHLFTISSSPATFSSDWVIISTHIGFRVLYGFVDGKNKTGSFRSSRDSVFTNNGRFPNKSLKIISNVFVHNINTKPLSTWNYWKRCLLVGSFDKWPISKKKRKRKVVYIYVTIVFCHRENWVNYN